MVLLFVKLSTRCGPAQAAAGATSVREYGEDQSTEKGQGAAGFIRNGNINSRWPTEYPARHE